MLGSFVNLGHLKLHLLSFGSVMSRHSPRSVYFNNLIAKLYLGGMSVSDQ